MQFSKRMEALQTSVFSSLDIEKEKMIKEGKEVLDFAVGSPDIAPSKKVMQALLEAASDKTCYMYSLKDTSEFRTTVKNWYHDRYQVELDENSEIMSLQGSQEGLAHIALTVCDEGDIVLIPSPSYPVFENGPRIANAQIYEMPMRKENDYLIRFDEIPETIAQKAKMMIISYPNNPTGATADDAFYEELIAFAKRYDILVVHDTAYSNLVFDGEDGKSFLSYPGAKEVGIEFNSFSKSYGMAGARIGICVGNAQAVSMLKKLKSNIDYGMFLPVQKAALAALTQDQSCVKQTCMQYQKRRDLLVEGLCALGWYVEKPKATMFIWAPLPDGYTNSEEFALSLLKECGILVTPGSAFGKEGEGFVRFALVQPEEIIEKALEILKEKRFLG